GAPGFGPPLDQTAQRELWLNAVQRRLKTIQDQAARSGQALRLYSQCHGLTPQGESFRAQSVALDHPASDATLRPPSNKEITIAQTRRQERLSAPAHEYAVEHLVDDLGSLLDEDRPPASLLLKSLESVSFEGFRQYQEQFRAQMQLVAFQFGQVHGKD